MEDPQVETQAAPEPRAVTPTMVRCQCGTEYFYEAEVFRLKDVFGVWQTLDYGPIGDARWVCSFCGTKYTLTGRRYPL